ncbi:MAG: methyltransferase domain-containing protein [Anaerolineae bacterium]|nr:methyltransferase domain-containing protein [Anaerolineae bacterium]
MAGVYWNQVHARWQGRPQALWRAHSDAVNAGLFGRWLAAPDGRVLKTDLFDEACSAGLYPLLACRSAAVVGIDVAAAVARAARGRWPALGAACADVHRLPFADGAFDVVISNSTLDHFDSLRQIESSLRELWRVLRPGGELLITLDNRANPAIALRNALPFGLLSRLGLVPYRVGATCGPCGLRALLAQAGFEVREITAVLHCPRVLAVPVAGLVARHGSPPAQQRLLRLLAAFEALERWPGRYLTGHYVAARASKPGS